MDGWVDGCVDVCRISIHGLDFDSWIGPKDRGFTIQNLVTFSCFWSVLGFYQNQYFYSKNVTNSEYRSPGRFKRLLRQRR